LDSSAALTQEIKAFILDAGLDMVGIASVDRWDHAPAGYYTPRDYMPGARAVISMVRHIPEGVIDVWGNWDEPGKTVGPYLHYAYGMANFDMAGIVHRAVKRLECAGHKAMAHAVATNCHYRSNGEPVPYWTTRPDWSQPHAAVAAGLGEFGLLGILISRRFGTHVRLASIITSAPLTIDPMYSGPPLCVPEACDRKCIRVCPVNAFSNTETTEIRIGDRLFLKARHDNIKCGAGVSGIVKGSGARSEVVLSDEVVDAAEVKRRSAEVHWADQAIRGQTFAIIGGNYCGRCLHVCPAPIGARHRRMAAVAQEEADA
jgi:epoxyqueuosine reductase QueG